MYVRVRTHTCTCACTCIRKRAASTWAHVCVELGGLQVVCPRLEVDGATRQRLRAEAAAEDAAQYVIVAQRLVQSRHLQPRLGAATATAARRRVSRYRCAGVTATSLRRRFVVASAAADVTALYEHLLQQIDA